MRQVDGAWPGSGVAHDHPMSPSREGPVLGLDTSGDPASACLLLPDQAPRVAIAPRGVRAGEILHALVATLLSEADMAPRDLSLIACVRGPGSFTGLRVGLAAASGLALASGVRAVGVETTAAMAAASGLEGRIAAILEGGQGRLFAGWHDVASGRLSLAEGPLDLSPSELRARLLAGGSRILVRGPLAPDSEWAALGALASEEPLAPAAARLARAGDAIGSLEALYARAPAIRPRQQP